VSAGNRGRRETNTGAVWSDTAPERPQHGHKPESRRLVLTASIMMALLSGGLIGWLVGVTSPQAGPESSNPLRTQPLSTEEGSSTTSTKVPEMTSSVAMKTPGRLEGRIAVASVPEGRSGASLWVIAPERVVQGPVVPLWPGDAAFAMVMNEDSLVFSGLQDVYLVDPDLQQEPQSVVEDAFILTSGSPDRVWLVGNLGRWVSALSLQSRELGPAVDIELVGRPLAGVAEGLIIRPLDSAQGELAYWTSLGGVQALEPTSDLIGASGNRIVLASRDNRLEIFDVVRRKAVAHFQTDPANRPIAYGCLSPDQAALLSAQDGQTLYSFGQKEPLEVAGWVSPRQLLAVTRGASSRTLRAIDPFESSSFDVAELRGEGFSWVLTSKWPCANSSAFG
jgi:hypothetical protein